MGFSPPVFSLGRYITFFDFSRRPLVAFLRLRLLFVTKLVNGTDRHHHDLDLWAGGEVTHLAQLRGIVNEEIEGRAGVDPFKCSAAASMV